MTQPRSGYCDDKNNVAGDGCDATCTVETGWECTLGDINNPSLCSDT